MIQRPPFSVDLLKSHEVTRILEHVNNTYMRNYTLYKYIFTPQVMHRRLCSRSDIRWKVDLQTEVR